MEKKENFPPFRCVLEGGCGEIVEKKSRFLATVRPVETEEEASAQPLRLKAAGDDGETGFVCSCHGKTHSFVVRRGEPRPFSLFRPNRTGKRLSVENPLTRVSNRGTMGSKGVSTLIARVLK